MFNTSFPRVIIRTALFAALTLSASNLFAQIPSGSSARSIPTEVERMDARVTQLIAQAEARFKEGELHLKAGERLQAREKFDKSVDAIWNPEWTFVPARNCKPTISNSSSAFIVWKSRSSKRSRASSWRRTPCPLSFNGQYQQDEKDAQQEPGSTSEV